MSKIQITYLFVTVLFQESVLNVSKFAFKHFLAF